MAKRREKEPDDVGALNVESNIEDNQEFISENTSKDDNEDDIEEDDSNSKDNVIYMSERRSKEKIANEKKDSKISVGISTIYAVIGLIVFLALVWFFTHKNANQVFVGDKIAGTIKETNVTADEIYNNAVAKLQTEKGVNIEVNEEVTLKSVHASSKEISSIDYVLSEVCNKFTYKVEATTISVDGKEVIILENEQKANDVLDKIKKKYTTDGTTIVEANFIQKVELNNKFVNNDEISTEDVAYNLLTATTNEDRVYEVVAGDTLFGIASNADMTMAELYKANPNINENSVLQLGQKINLVVPVPVLSVKTVEQVKYTQSINAETIIVENNQEYKTYEKVIQTAKAGQQEITAKVVKVNGYEEERTIVDTKVITEPIPAKIERGTLQVPPKKAMGSFIYPVSGRFSSGYGSRWGRFHKGIDLAAGKGTPIYASDGGVVKFSGWNSGGYGNLIIINHENGYETYYGHNSKNVVSAGERVYQGQLIGYVGSTGDSTGNHVHFEVRKNGSATNPLNYLN